MKIRLAFFASGAGSNVQNAIHYFREHPVIEVAAVLANKSCGAVEIANREKIDTFIFNREELQSGKVLEFLQKNAIDGIVLAGFLWKIPELIIGRYAHKIINVHPALLPKYGGKGMYGLHVHEAVIASGEKETGITIHLVNENYDEGAVLEQHRCEVFPEDTKESLQERIKSLEKDFFPKAVEAYFLKESTK